MIEWRPANRRTPRGKWLQAMGDVPDKSLLLDKIQQWCQEHDCGTRMSYDMWKFKTKQQMTVFLLKWS
jgi:membrane-bound lytic murein transglycosylase